MVLADMFFPLALNHHHPRVDNETTSTSILGIILYVIHMDHWTCTNRIQMPQLKTCFDLQTENLYANPLSFLPTWLLQKIWVVIFGAADRDLAQINNLLVSTFWVPLSNIKNHIHKMFTSKL
jgi:hypothetical protein